MLKESSTTKIWRLLLCIIGIVIIGLLIRELLIYFNNDIDLFIKFNKHYQHLFWNDIRAHQDQPATLVLVMSLLVAMAAVPGFPVSAICILIGAIYGREMGFGINLVGIVLGNLVTYTILGKLGLSKFIQHHDGRVIRNISKMKYPAVGLAIGYAVPIIPTIFVNFSAAKLKLRLRNVILSMIAGSLPAAALYATGGDFLNRGNFKIGLITIFCICILFIFIKQLMKYEKSETRSRGHEGTE